ncbi:MAG: glyoxylate/hydroxypyruvate reductase A [Alphaproteobacteria bacterium]|nr:glyoxylate/hydroxypyruvate reductase A [Alphaproteobacteria bacterium]
MFGTLSVTLLIIAPGERPDWWQREFARLVPDLEVRAWPDVGDPADIRSALAWKPPSDELAKLPNLKAIWSMGAGIDHILVDDALPDVPITRVVDPYLTAGITEYVLLHVLRYHRNQPVFEAQQRDHVWDDRARDLRQADERPVGVMGLGELGRDAVAKLTHLGFDTAGWSRTAKDISGVACFHGPDGLAPFLARSEILVCLLPLTDQTAGILDRDTLARLPEGAYLINAARGGHLVEADLIDALAAGQITHATLDVFHEEPLPGDHPFWDHPQITMTPHNASITDPRSVVAQVAENIRRLEAGEPLLHQVDRVAGY